MIQGMVWFFIAYFIVAYGGRVLLHLIGVPALLRGLALKPFNDMPAPYSGFEPPVSVIVKSGADPAAAIAATHALLDLDYASGDCRAVEFEGDALGIARDFRLSPGAHGRKA